jgi:hypothetical protein
VKSDYILSIDADKLCGRDFTLEIDPLLDPERSSTECSTYKEHVVDGETLPNSADRGRGVRQHWCPYHAELAQARQMLTRARNWTHVNVQRTRIPDQDAVYFTFEVKSTYQLPM